MIVVTFCDNSFEGLLTFNDQCNFPRFQLKYDVGNDNSSERLLAFNFHGFLVADMLICKQIGRSSRYDGPTTLQVSIEPT